MNDMLCTYVWKLARYIDELMCTMRCIWDLPYNKGFHTIKGYRIDGHGYEMQWNEMNNDLWDKWNESIRREKNKNIPP